MSTKYQSIELVFKEIEKQTSLLHSNATIVTERAKTLMIFLVPAVTWFINNKSYITAILLASIASFTAWKCWLPTIVNKKEMYNASKFILCKEEELKKALAEQMEEWLNYSAPLQGKRMNYLKYATILTIISILLSPLF